MFNLKNSTIWWIILIIIIILGAYFLFTSNENVVLEDGLEIIPTETETNNTEGINIENTDNSISNEESVIEDITTENNSSDVNKTEESSENTPVSQ